MAKKEMCLRPIYSKGGALEWERVPIDSLKPAYGDLYADEDTGEVWIFNGTNWVSTLVHIKE